VYIFYLWDSDTTKYVVIICIGVIGGEGGLERLSPYKIYILIEVLNPSLVIYKAGH